MQPLNDLRVLDFTTLLPGPLATLYMAEAGARVVKVERPTGDPSRANRPQRAGQSLQFSLLNKGKTGLVADLKDPAELEMVRALAVEADVLVEQFRPGVMSRLGLGYDALKADNPGLVYCSITGFGQRGPLAQRAGHDLTYLARAGMLRLTADGDGLPTLPPGQIADIGGGSLSAVIAILTALLRRQRSGLGAQLDISMTENLFPWMARALAPVLDGGDPPPPGRGRHTGGSARYGVYMSSDSVAFAVAPLEEKFWQTFCRLIGLPHELCDENVDPVAARMGVARCLASHTAAELEAMFDGHDVCVERVRNVAEALTDPHFVERGTFSRGVIMPDGAVVPALPMPFPDNFLESDTQVAPMLEKTGPCGSEIWGNAAGWSRWSLGDISIVQHN
ncbi:CaiB/BaiF CoA transferase family protein [Pontitalea aquivivens]|uniref:CaiB/BaiF CoA transferase family protein n=1 Tax=Pontitalea aquivivens TaxID=3388663 RepID=UPI0039708A6F